MWIYRIGFLSEEGPCDGVCVSGFSGACFSNEDNNSFTSPRWSLWSSPFAKSFDSFSEADSVARESSSDLIFCSSCKYCFSEHVEVVSFSLAFACFFGRFSWEEMLVYSTIVFLFHDSLKFVFVPRHVLIVVPTFFKVG